MKPAGRSRWSSLGKTAGTRLVALLLVLVSSAPYSAGAQDLPPYDPIHPVEVPTIGPFYGVRLRGLGGAYTAVAEGPEGTLTSLASLANRRPNEAGYFHWNGTLSWALPAGDLDVSNNGRSVPTGFNLMAVGVVLRFARLGFGLFVESMGMSDLSETGREVRANRAVAGVAYALPGDEWIFGAGIHSVGYRLDLPDFGVVEASKPYLGADALWRPLGRNYRLGASFKATGWAELPQEDNPDMPPAVVRPWEVSVGGALWLGDGYLNLPLPTADEMEPQVPSRVGLLLSLDIFVIGPPSTRGAPVAGLEAYFEDKLQLASPKSVFGVRLGGETEAVANRVRMRGGFWVEPSRFEDVSPRLHWTGGFDLRLFRIYKYQLRTSLVFDFATQYRFGGISIGFW